MVLLTLLALAGCATQSERRASSTDPIIPAGPRAAADDPSEAADSRRILGAVREVFPDAELKIFMNASSHARAARRYKELLERGENVSYEEVLKNVQERDHIDSNRTFSPLRKAEDAIEFDNTDMGLEEQFERIYNYAMRIIEKTSD